MPRTRQSFHAACRGFLRGSQNQCNDEKQGRMVAKLWTSVTLRSRFHEFFVEYAPCERSLVTINALSVAAKRNMPAEILLVEDDPEMAAVLSQGFEQEKYSVSVAADGYHALRRALEYPFRAIVLDVMLPGLDGFAVTA